MLPSTLFERVLKCHGLRTWPLRGEKRESPRIPMRKRVLVHLIKGRRILEPIPAWTRDISLRGVGIMVSTRVQVGAEFLVDLLPSPEACALASRSPALYRLKRNEANATPSQTDLSSARNSRLSSTDVRRQGRQTGNSRALHPDPSATASVILHCRVSRVRQECDLSTLLGAEFLRLMIPDTDRTPENGGYKSLFMEDLLWIDVRSETPPDPMLLQS